MGGEGPRPQADDAERRLGVHPRQDAHGQRPGSAPSPTSEVGSRASGQEILLEDLADAAGRMEVRDRVAAAGRIDVLLAVVDAAVDQRVVVAPVLALYSLRTLTKPKKPRSSKTMFSARRS